VPKTGTSVLIKSDTKKNHSVNIEIRPPAPTP
jgi:hypothetical protein